jgi:hypothetical protein
MRLFRYRRQPCPWCGANISSAVQICPSCATIVTPPAAPATTSVGESIEAESSAPRWVRWPAFIAVAVSMFVVFPLVFAIRSFAEAAVAVPLLLAWLWFWRFGLRRGWWEGGE